MAASDMYSNRTKWTEDMEDLLVDWWQQYECLYNVSSVTYHNRAEKDRCWGEIAVALDLPVEEVKGRATTLRTQYSRLLKIRLRKQAMTPRQKRILTSLKFLREHVVPRSTESNFDRSTKDTLTTQQDSDDIKPETAAFSLDLDSGRSLSPVDNAAARTIWTVGMEDKLIELWQQHDCLYDSTDRFSDRMEREKKWAEIAFALDIPVQDVKVRATSLRTQYSRLVKPQASGRMKKPITARQKRILRSCKFLRKHINHRSTEGNFDTSMEDVLRTQQGSSDSEPENTALSQDLDGRASPSPTESSSVSPPPPPPPQLAKNQTKTPNITDNERQKLALLEHILDVIQGTSREPKKDCEDAFGVTIAMELKKIRNPVLRNRVKRQIMTILYDALDSEQMTDTDSYQPQHTFPREEPHSITVVIP